MIYSIDVLNIVVTFWEDFRYKYKELHIVFNNDSEYFFSSVQMCVCVCVREETQVNKQLFWSQWVFVEVF